MYAFSLSHFPVGCHSSAGGPCQSRIVAGPQAAQCAVRMMPCIYHKPDKVRTVCVSHTTLQLSHVLNGLKFMLAVPGSQILSEGMTQAQVHTAMEQLRSSSTTASVAGVSGTATPLMKAAARRLSLEAAISGSGTDPAAGAASSISGAAALGRRLSTDAAATAAALLQEASHISHVSKLGAGQQRLSSDTEEAEPLDVATAVSLAEACAQVGLNWWLQW